MKKKYSKPVVYFEELRVDMPFASTCDKDHIADVKELLAQGWFNASHNCDPAMYITDDAGENLFWDDNKLCYYSAVNQAFTS